MNDIFLGFVVGLVGISLIGGIILLLASARKRRKEKTPADIHEEMVKELKQWGVFVIIATIMLIIVSWVTLGALDIILAVVSLATAIVMANLFFKTKDPVLFAMYAAMLLCLAVIDGLSFFSLPRNLMPPDQLIIIPALVVGRLLFASYLFRTFAKYRKNESAYIEQTFGVGPERKTLDQAGLETFWKVGSWMGFIAIGLTPFAMFFLIINSINTFLLLFDVIVSIAPVGIGIGFASLLSDHPEQRNWIWGGATGGLAFVVVVIGYFGFIGSSQTQTASGPSGQIAVPLPTATAIRSTQVLGTPIVVTETASPPPSDTPAPTRTPTLAPTDIIVDQVQATYIHSLYRSADFASLDSSNNRIIIGDPRLVEPGDGDENFTGAANIYTLTAEGTWVLEAELSPPPDLVDDQTEPDPNERIHNGFGGEVAIYNDLAVTMDAYSTNDEDLVFPIYINENNRWSYLNQIEVPFEQFGGVSLDMTAEYIVIGDGVRRFRSENGLIRTGVVEVFRREDREWVHDATLHPPESEVADQIEYFGISVSIDGNTLAVWANYLPDQNGPVLYIFQQDPTDGWQLRQQLSGKLTNDYSLGSTRAVVKGSTIITSGSDDKGRNAVLVIDDISALGDWRDVSITEIKSFAPYWYFGAYIAFDGQYLAVPSSTDFDAMRTDIIHIYRRNPDDPSRWILEKTIGKAVPLDLTTEIRYFRSPMTILNQNLIFFGVDRIPDTLNAIDLAAE